MNPPVPYGYRLLGDNEVMPEGTLRIDGIDSTPEWLPGQDSSAGKTVKQFKDQFRTLQVKCVCAPVEVPEGHRLVEAEEKLPREYKWCDPDEWHNKWIDSPLGVDGVYTGMTPTRARLEHPARNFAVRVEVDAPKLKQGDLEKWLLRQISDHNEAIVEANESSDLANAWSLQTMLLIYNDALCKVQCGCPDIEACVQESIEGAGKARVEALGDDQIGLAITLGYEQMAMYEILRKITA